MLMRVRRRVYCLYALLLVVVALPMPGRAARQTDYPGLDVIFAVENTAAAERFDPGGLRFRAVRQAITRLTHFRRDLHALGVEDVSIHVAALTFTDDSAPRVLLPWAALPAAGDPPVLPAAPPPEGTYPDLRGALTGPNGALAYFDQLDLPDPDRRLQVVVVFNAERPLAGSVNDIYAHMEDVTGAFEDWRRDERRQLYVYGFNPDNADTDTSYWGGDDGRRGSRMGYYWGEASGGSAAQVAAPAQLLDRLVNLAAAWAGALLTSPDYSFSASLITPAASLYEMPAYGLRARFILLGSTVSAADLRLVAPDGLPVGESAGARVARGDGLVTWEIDNPLPGPWQVNIDGIANGVVVDWVRLRPAHFAFHVSKQGQQYQDVTVRLDITGANGLPLPAYDTVYRLNTALRITAPSGAALPVDALDYTGGVYALTFTPVEVGMYTVELTASYGDRVFFGGSGSASQTLEILPTTVRLEPATTTLLQDATAPVALRFYDAEDQPITGGIQLEAASATMYQGETCGDKPLEGIAPVLLAPAPDAGGAWAGAFHTPPAGGYKGLVMLCATLNIRDALGGTISRAANARAEVVAVSVLSMQLAAPGAPGATVGEMARESIFPFAPVPVTIAVQVSAGDAPFVIPAGVIEAERQELGAESVVMATVQRAGSGAVQRVPLTQRAGGVWSNAPDPDNPAGDIPPLYLDPDTYTITIEVPQDVLGDSNLKFGPVDAGGSYTLAMTLVRTTNPLMVAQIGGFSVAVTGAAALLARNRFRARRLARYPVTGMLAIVREDAKTGARTVRRRIDLDALGVNHHVLRWGEFPVANPPLSHLEVQSNERLWNQDRAIRVRYAAQQQPPVWSEPLRRGDAFELWRDAAGNIYYLVRGPIGADDAPPEAAELPAAPIPRPSADSLFGDDDGA
ncbi:MAG: hypothetical protein JXB47_16005 [Anaerolineae bacterium]|nr:hypothetical protein [Anaerolineae bacterium]